MTEILPKPILNEAENITSGARRRDYGRPYINHWRIALKWARRLYIRQLQGKPLITPSVVADMMKDLKDARGEQLSTYDNLLDDVGYTVCKDDMARERVELGWSPDYQSALYDLDHQDVLQIDERYMLLEERQPKG